MNPRCMFLIVVTALLAIPLWSQWSECPLLGTYVERRASYSAKVGFNTAEQLAEYDLSVDANTYWIGIALHIVTYDDGSYVADEAVIQQLLVMSRVLCKSNRAILPVGVEKSKDVVVDSICA
jgi:hypothetical protein